MSGGDASFLAPSGSLSIADGEGWGEAASLLVRPKNLPFFGRSALNVNYVIAML